MARFIHEGKSIDYTPAGDTAAGTVVVQGELVGVAARDIKANKLGALSVSGVIDFPKQTGALTAISAGALCYWDAGNTRATPSAGGGANKLIGKCVIAAGDGDALVRIRMSQ